MVIAGRTLDEGATRWASFLQYLRIRADMKEDFAAIHGAYCTTGPPSRMTSNRDELKHGACMLFDRFRRVRLLLPFSPEEKSSVLSEKERHKDRRNVCSQRKEPAEGHGKEIRGEFTLGSEQKVTDVGISE